MPKFRKAIIDATRQRVPRSLRVGEIRRLPWGVLIHEGVTRDGRLLRNERYWHMSPTECWASPRANEQSWVERQRSVGMADRVTIDANDIRRQDRGSSERLH